LASLQEELSTVRDDWLRLSKEIETLRSQKAAAETARAADLGKLQDGIRTREEEIGELKQKIEQDQGDKEELSKKLARVEIEKADKEREFNALIQQPSGFPEINDFNQITNGMVILFIPHSRSFSPEIFSMPSGSAKLKGRIDTTQPYVILDKQQNVNYWLLIAPHNTRLTNLISGWFYWGNNTMKARQILK
jgi:hypothetical protein